LFHGGGYRGTYRILPSCSTSGTVRCYPWSLSNKIDIIAEQWLCGSFCSR
jgi:hypothetical protein